MAKPKPKKVASPDRPSAAGANRREKLASLEAARKSEQRRRTIGLLVICLVLAMGLLAYPVYLFVDDYQARSATLGDIGLAASAAGCDEISEAPATGNQQHVADGTKVPYDRTPPDSGPHYNTPAPFTKRFYTADDRPPVEMLVHNLEHGYTVVWYRDGAPAEDVDALQQISKTFSASDYDPNQKFIAAPWTTQDGAFPEGKNVVITRWYANPANPADQAAQKGVRQACVSVSGEAIKSFMDDYPSTDSPEPNAA